MGSRDKGGREPKKPKKTAPDKLRPVSETETYSTVVEVVPRKRKPREDEE